MANPKLPYFLVDDDLRLYYLMNSSRITRGMLTSYFHPNGSVLLRDRSGRFASTGKLAEFLLRE